MVEGPTRFACDHRFPAGRIIRFIEERTEHFGLDLTELTVLTEAATGYYRVTPIVAAMSGAKRVLALAKDTRFGSVDDVRQQTTYLAKQAGVEDSLVITTRRDAETFGAADIVTNLGGVRPLDAQVVAALRPTAVISLMFGGNDWRPHELDLGACYEQGIAVVGVDEDAIDLFRFTGVRILWFLTELGIETVGCTMLFVGEGVVFSKVMSFLSRMGAHVLAVTSESTGRVSLYGGKKIAEHLDEDTVREALENSTAFLTFDPLRERVFIGADGELSAQELADIAPSIAVVNYSGHVDRARLREVGIDCFPRYDPGGGHSASTIGEILPAPVVELHTAGLRVAEIMARARRAGCTPEEAEREAVRSNLGEDLRPFFVRYLSRTDL